MSEFWWGFVALPLIIVGLALVLALVFGAWRVIEWWLEGRWAKLAKVEVARKVPADMQLFTRTKLGKRGLVASAVLTFPTVWWISLHPNAGIVFVRGGKHAHRFQHRQINEAIESTLDRMAEEQEGER